MRRLTPDELAARAPEWDGLVTASRRPNPFQLAGSVLAWCDTAPGDAEVAALAAERNGELVAALALAIVRRGPVRRLEPVGARESVPADVLADPRDLAAVPPLVEAARALDFDYAQLAALDAGGALAGPANGLSLIRRLDGPVIDVAPGPDAFDRLLSRNARKALTRRTRRLQELGRLRIETCDTPTALEEMLSLHERRWVGRGGRSSFCTPGGQALHHHIVRRLAGRGIVRATTVRLDERLLAFQYAFLVGRSLVCLRIAHDPGFARYSPGTLALKAGIEDGAACGAHRVELLGHQESYKLRLATSFEPMSWGIGWARTARGSLACRIERSLLRLRVGLRDRSLLSCG